MLKAQSIVFKILNELGIGYRELGRMEPLELEKYDSIDIYDFNTTKLENDSVLYDVRHQIRTMGICTKFENQMNMDDFDHLETLRVIVGDKNNDSLCSVMSFIESSPSLKNVYIYTPSSMLERLSVLLKLQEEKHIVIIINKFNKEHVDLVIDIIERSKYPIGIVDTFIDKFYDFLLDCGKVVVLPSVYGRMRVTTLLKDDPYYDVFIDYYYMQTYTV